MPRIRIVADEVTYAVGWGWLGEAAHRLIVRRMLERIFGYRARVIPTLLEALHE
jgi:hypothetical protein